MQTFEEIVVVKRNAYLWLLSFLQARLLYLLMNQPLVVDLMPFRLRKCQEVQYNKFDDIVLLTEGSPVYAGPARGEPLAYFSKLGHHCPYYVNPAEFLADLISINYSSTESVVSSQMRIDSLVKSFSKRLSTIIYPTQIAKEVLHKNEKRIGMRTVAKKKGGWWKQFWLLLRRSWMQASSDGPTNKVQATMSIATAVFFGSVFWRMGRSQTSRRDRKRLLQVAAINTAMATLTKAVGVFPKERAIVNIERAKGSYSLSPYLFSKLLAEIPIGAAFPLMFGAVLYPKARLHPTLLSFFAPDIMRKQDLIIHETSRGKKTETHRVGGFIRKIAGGVSPKDCDRRNFKVNRTLTLTFVNIILFPIPWSMISVSAGRTGCDTIVGDANVEGISGREKKRLSLAIELLASPFVIYADEPTSGLDAFQAEKVVETLQQLAQDGHTIIYSIQQPRCSVYNKFDDIVLLTEGSLVYAGPARGEPLAYLSKLGLSF
ncbi:hypothetical protein K1719_029798 [Acacia pycnantha]|nr:hypothetical protein K1719_029798 [Acacia pycnantha]